MPFKTVNPATGELVRTFEEISDRDLELVLGRRTRRTKLTGVCGRWPNGPGSYLVPPPSCGNGLMSKPAT
jgi:hypothetical protein